MSDKYSKNRNLWRKVYGHQRRKPVVETFVDAVNAVTFSYDLNKIQRHRDYFIIKGSNVFIPSGIVYAEYQEGLVLFSNTIEETINFNSCFSAEPDAVVLTIESATDNSHNIIVYGLDFDACSMSIGLSAPFDGAIRYRAVYSSTGYPAVATSTFEPSSGTFTIYAGQYSVNNEEQVVIPYDVNGFPDGVFLTSWDESLNYDVNVYLSGSNGLNNSTVNLSAPMENSLYYIAFRTIV